MPKRFSIILFSAAVLMLSACLKRNQFPPEPKITELRFVANPDCTAVMFIKFTDGDGDIGLGQGDTFPPFNPGSEFNSNLFFNYFEFEAGAWKRVYLNIDPVSGDTVNPFSYRIPPLETDGRDNSLEGEIAVDMPFGYFLQGTPNDSLRYEVVLYDRALQSSTATTEVILKP